MPPFALTCEGLTDPLGIDVRRPRLSWRYEESFQTAYQIQAGGWDSGRVASAQSIHVPYGGPELTSRQRVSWRVRIWTEGKDPSEWSEEAWWEMGLLEESNWIASWIEPDREEDPQERHPAPFFRHEFALDGEVISARLYITAHGVYRAHLNGRVVGDAVLTPGFTSYHHRLQVQSYDVTAALRRGRNALGAIVGDGWWRGTAGIERNVYGTRLGLLAQLHVTLANGGERAIGTDGEWTSSTGPILRSDLRDGEIYDARLEMPGWDEPDFEQTWQPVRVADHSKANLVAPIAPPVRRRERLRPVAILKTPSGQTVVDFGQNIAGRVRLTISGPANKAILLKHGEALDQEGNFSMKHLQLPLPGAQELLQEVRYTLSGRGTESFEPLFTFHGFRYALAEGFDPSLDVIEAVALYSDLDVIGEFECSDPRLNQLQSNILWSQKGNFLSIPTDCPQRERNGWTGDAQLYARTGLFLMDARNFYRKYLLDLAVDQHDSGLVPNLIPDPAKPRGRRSFFRSLAAKTAGAAGWGDAAVILPWTLYRMTGDIETLRRQYPSMKRWVAYVEANARKIPWYKAANPAFWLDGAKRRREPLVWDNRYHWGEWLEPGDFNSVAAMMGGFVRRMLFSAPEVATAYFAHSTRLMAETAGTLEFPNEAEEYRRLSDRVRQAFIEEFVTPDGRVGADKQASYVRALHFDLLPEKLRPAATARLIELIRKAGTHLGTGFLSTPFLLPVLAETGQLDIAYELLLQDTAPSWLYPLTKGATTIWETWEGIAPDGKVTASLNHYAYGAVGSFLYEYVAGIRPLEPGFRRVEVHPHPGGGLTYARASHTSPYGRIASSWWLKGGNFELEVEIPGGVSADIILPDGSSEQKGAGKHRFEQARAG